MQYCPALTCWRRFSNRRGAVLLLAVYFVSLTLLILGGVSLQRTVMESRASQVSRDTQQAFYLAEAGFDQALTELRADIAAVPDETPQTRVYATGTVTYTVETLSEPGERPVRRRITAIGSVKGATQQVLATIQENLATPDLSGLVNGGLLSLTGPLNAASPSDYMQIAGRIHVQTGISGAILINNAKMNGTVSIGEPHLDPILWLPPAYTNLYISGGGYGPFGAGVQASPGLAAAHFTPAALPSAETLLPVPDDPDYGIRIGDTWSSTLEADPTTSCEKSHGAHVNNGHLSLGGSTTMVIADGHPLDLSPANGEIAICLQSVTLTGDSTLRFDAPATVYLVGQAPAPISVNHVTPFKPTTLGTVPYRQAERAALRGVQGESASAEAVELVVPTWVQGPPPVGNTVALEHWAKKGAVLFAGGTFRGSVWAPYSKVSFYSDRDAGDDLNPANIFGRDTSIRGYSKHESFNFGTPSSEASDAEDENPITVLSWTTQ